MIHGFTVAGGRLRRVADPIATLSSLVWIDLVEPSDSEEAILEQQLGLDVPTREEMQEIEVSSRLYVEDDTAFMTASLPARTDSDDLLMGPVTFVLARDRLITVRYHEPRAFRTFPQRAEKVNLGCTNGVGVLNALLEATVDRLADIVERAEQEVDAISHEIFRVEDPAARSQRDLNRVLQLIGRKGDLTSNIRDSLLSLARLAGFLAQLLNQRDDKDGRGRVKTMARDVHSLTDHVSFLSQKITFLLDATLGMINIEQSNIIKIFSIATGVFLPPTLIASIYGMNFAYMPELHWRWGYPLAGVLMLLSALLPCWWFRRRGWL
jgi:magnesium transporter